MNRDREFYKNTLILLIGKFSTQFITLLLLPLYTHYLLTSDYGFVDLLQTYISLFIPILTLRLDSSVFRFLIDCRKNENAKKNIISNTLFLLIVTVIFTSIIGIILINIFNIKYSVYLLINLIVMMLSNVLLQVLRGLGKNKEYSISSIITGTCTLIINAVLIIIFKYDARSIFISSIVANLLCCIFVIFTANVNKYFIIDRINKKTIKEMLLYSLPMIPNTLSWWIVNVSDRTIISIFLGTSVNGIYTVSCKFSNIINGIYSIVNMSWQETASLHINDKDKDEFFSEMINKIFFLFSCISLLIVAIIPFIYNTIIGKEYFSSYKYIPILLYSNIWNVLVGLIGGIYIALKKTKQVANTTIISAIINFIVNIVLIKFIGLYAACVSTLISYIAVSIYRYYDCKKYVNIKLKLKKFIIFSIVYVILSLVYIYHNLIICFIALIVAVIYSFIVNKDIIKSIISGLFKKI